MCPHRRFETKQMVSQNLQNVPDDIPVQSSGIIYYEVHSDCNLRCVHCADYFRRENKSIPVDDLIRFHKKICQYSPHVAVVTGGEPLLYRDLDQLLTGLCDHAPHVILTTNGTLLMPEQGINLLSRYDNLFIQVSVDAANEKIFDAIRGEGTFAKVSARLLELAEEGMGHRLALSMTVLRQNLAQVESVIQWAEQLGVSTVHFPSLLHQGRARYQGSNIYPSPESQLLLEEKLLRMINQSRPDGPRLSVNRLEQIATRITGGLMSDCLCTVTFKVDACGWIHPCPCSFNDLNSLGNISDPALPGKLLERMNQQHAALEANRLVQDTRCMKCPGQKVCLGKFCEACCIAGPVDAAALDYTCQILQHHYTVAMEGRHS